MTGTTRVDHTGIAVWDLDEATRRYSGAFGGVLSNRMLVPEQGVEVAFLALGDTRIELLRPLSPGSAVGRFLERRGEGLHHICIRVEDIRAELDRLGREGIQLIDREPRAGAHGLIAFVHPREAHGVLIELLEQQNHVP